MQNSTADRLYIRLSGIMKVQWFFFLVLFWGIFFTSNLAFARIVMPVIWVLVCFQLFIYWISKGRRADITKHAVERLDTTFYSLMFVVLSDAAITTHLLVTLPRPPLHPHLKHALGIFLWETCAIYVISYILSMIITRVYLANQEKKTLL